MAERRGIAFGLFSAVVVVATIALAGWLAWRQSQEVRAPNEAGVCWRMDTAGKFSPLVRNSKGIEACAGDLERIHLATGESLTGAYQGRFIFVDKEAIRSSETLSGERWRLYFDNQRDALDKKLNAHEMVVTTAPPPAP